MVKSRLLFMLFCGLTLASSALTGPRPFQRQSGGPGSKDDTLGMALIPAGEFWMGRNQLWLVDELGWNERDRLDDRPVHLVYVDAFYIDRYETSNEDYQRFVEASGHRTPFHWAGGKIPSGKDRHPAYNISWDDADAYCKWMGKRLPTEAEWERAARGGLDKKLYPWGDQLTLPPQGSATSATTPAQNVKAAHSGSPRGPAAIGSYPPNVFDLYDVTGNVWEWVSDWYDRDYYSGSPDRNPRGPSKGIYRVFRGGGWSDSDERNLMVHYRNYTDAATRSPTIGVRCARSMPANAR